MFRIEMLQTPVSHGSSVRLVELCTKLDEAEALAKGEQQYQQQQHHSNAYHQSQQQRQQVGAGDPTADEPRVVSDGRGSERGEEGGEGGRGNDRLNEPSRQPNTFEDTGSGNVTSENDRGRYVDFEEIMSPQWYRTTGTSRKQ